MATDLAEFVGAAIALNLLFGVPLFVAGLMTAVVAFGILALQTRGYRRFELAIGAMLAVIVLLGFLYDRSQVGADGGEVAGGFVPGFDGARLDPARRGILGATVMPHVDLPALGADAETASRSRTTTERHRLLRFQRSTS